MNKAMLLAALMIYSVFATAGLKEPTPALGPERAPQEIAPIEAPFDMPQLVRPTFPDRQFDIRDFGAVAGGDTKNTAAFAAAITACSEAGGGTVLVPEGTWLTGAIHLKSNVNLHLAAGSLIVFSNDPQDYLPVVFTRWAGFELYNYSPLIYARDCENIAITGPGALDGNGAEWRKWFKAGEDTAQRAYEERLLTEAPVEKRVFGTPEAGLRPQFISPINCRNVLLEGFRIVGPGPFWTIHFVYCDHVIARGLQVYTVGGPNNDGLNVDSSANVLIEHCLFDTEDDCVCMKAGINEDGLRVARPTENVVVRYCITKRGHGGIVFGSDTSGWLRNVYVHDCVYDGTDIGVRLKSTRGRGGGIENVYCENIQMKDILMDAITLNTAYKAWFGTVEGPAPIFRNIHIRNVSCNGAENAAKIEGLPDAPISNLVLENVVIRAQNGFQANLISGLTLDNVSVTADKGPKFALDNASNLTIK